MYENFFLSVLDLNNNTHKVYCFGYEHSIEYVKFALAQTTDIRKKNISLYLNNIELMDHQTLKECGIDKTTVLRMFFKLKAGR